MGLGLGGTSWGGCYKSNNGTWIPISKGDNCDINIKLEADQKAKAAAESNNTIPKLSQTNYINTTMGTLPPSNNTNTSLTGNTTENNSNSNSAMPCFYSGVYTADCRGLTPENISFNPPEAKINTPTTQDYINKKMGLPDSNTKITATTNNSGDTQNNNGNNDSKKTTASTGAGCGGNFGGANCETTDAINMGVGAANKLIQTVGMVAVQGKGTDAQNNVMTKGTTATNADYLNAQADTADAAKTANIVAAGVQTVNAGLQTWRALAHNASIKTIQTNADSQKQKCEPLTDAAKMACEKDNKAIQTLADTEIAKQKDKAMQTGVAAALTAEQAGGSAMNASMAASTADNLRKQANLSNSATAYSFSPPPTAAGQDSTITPTMTPDSGGITASTSPSPGPLGAANNDFNPNSLNNTAVGPPPGTFTPDKNSPAPAGSAGLGGSGGTSASRDTGGDGKQDGGPTKGQTGGQYAGGDGASPKFSRGSSGSGGGVGLDTSFADLLKKMLPGGGDEKKDAQQASLSLDQDRSPASNQAAVMGRNKNIFFEISKRYQKKSTEGAVQFQ